EDGTDYVARGAGDAGESAKKIQRRALCGEDRTGRPAHLDQDLPGSRVPAVGDEDFCFHAGVKQTERTNRDLETGDAPRRAGNERAFGSSALVYYGVRREITSETQILLDGSAHRGF